MNRASVTADEPAQVMSRGGVAVPFPFKLHELLERANHDESLAQILSWQPHGRCFVVHKPSLFVDYVMTSHFTQTKFASFQRQLNLYGFVRLATGRDKNGYYHEHFLRGHPELVSKLTRQKIKGTKVRKAVTPGMEPSFYGMPFLPVPDLKPGEPEGDPELRAVVSSASLSQLAPSARHSMRASVSMSSLSAATPFVHSVPSVISHASSSSMVGSAAGVRHTTPPPFNVDSDEPPAVTPPAPPQIVDFGWSATHALGSSTISTVPTKLQKSVSNPTLPSFHSTGDLLFFEGKPFHYIDREVMMKIRKPLASRPVSQEQHPLAHMDIPSPVEISLPQEEQDVGLNMDNLWSPTKEDNPHDAFTAKDIEWMFS